MKPVKQYRMARCGSGWVIMLGWILITVFTFLVISVVASVSGQLQHVKGSAQMALDRYTIQIGRDIIQSVKNGHHYTPVLQADLFHKDFREVLGIDENYTHKDEQGKIIYSLVNVKPGFHITNQLDTQVTFTLRIPIRIGESTLFTAEFPLSLTGTYQYKY